MCTVFTMSFTIEAGFVAGVVLTLLTTGALAGGCDCVNPTPTPERFGKAPPARNCVTIVVGGGGFVRNDGVSKTSTLFCTAVGRNAATIMRLPSAVMPMCDWFRETGSVSSAPGSNVPNVAPGRKSKTLTVLVLAFTLCVTYPNTPLGSLASRVIAIENGFAGTPTVWLRVLRVASMISSVP